MLQDFDVTVICVVPSYNGRVEDTYKKKKYYFENINGIKVIRVRVPEFAKTNKLSRIRNIIAYFLGALGASNKTGKQDYIFTISQPPLIGGLLGVIGKWKKKAKMIYCIQDFNPEQIMAVGYSKNSLILKIMMIVDKFSCGHSDLVITVGRDLVMTLEKRFAGKEIPAYVMINNWVDEKQIYPLNSDHEQINIFRKKYNLEDKFVIMYSGNIGLYYDLENLIKVIRNFAPGTKTIDGREVVFAFVGDGALLGTLRNYVNSHNMENVVFIPYQSKDNLIYSLNAADVHWVVNAKGIKGVSVPSKWYGIVSTARPILAVLEKGSEIRMLTEEIGCGLVCEPGEYDIVEKNIQWFLNNAGSEEMKNMGDRGREYLVKYLTKNRSIQKYIEAIKKL